MLYQRYRPFSFENMVGNKGTIAALKGAIKERNIQVYLFFGPPGSGKTTAARILSGFLCSNPIDVYELNSANNRGIDTIREVNEYMSISGFGDGKVVILDEAHKITKDGFDALLKNLEDTPPGVYVIMCTTEPNKIPKAIKQRATAFSFSSVSNKEVLGVLNKVIKQEGATIDASIVETIVLNSEGLLRKALILLEGVLLAETDKEKMDYLKNASIADEADPEIIDLLRELVRPTPSVTKIRRILISLNNQNTDSEMLRRTMLKYIGKCLLSQSNMKLAKRMEYFMRPTYDIGFSGIIYMCYKCVE